MAGIDINRTTTNVINDPEIHVGVGTYYHDPVNDPRDFAKNNVLYHFPGCGDQLIIGKYCSIACGATFVCAGGFHSSRAISSYPFGLASGYWDIPPELCTVEALFDVENRGETIVGNDVWLGYQSLIMPGVTIGDNTVIGAGSVVTKDIPANVVAVGNPCRVIREIGDRDREFYFKDRRIDWDNL